MNVHFPFTPEGPFLLGFLMSHVSIKSIGPVNQHEIICLQEN